MTQFDGWGRNLQNAVTIASVPEILEAEISLAFGELVAESLLEFGARSTHQTKSIPNINYRRPLRSSFADSTQRLAYHIQLGRLPNWFALSLCVWIVRVSFGSWAWKEWRLSFFFERERRKGNERKWENYRN